MKTTMNTKVKLVGIGLVSAVALSSCSENFLEEKKNYDYTTPDIYNYESGCQGRIDDIYGWCLPAVTDMTWKYPSVGNADAAGKSTEEYSGFSDFVDPQIELTSTGTGNSVPDFFLGNISNVQENPYGRIRNINDVIAGINGGSLSQEKKNAYLGHAYFFRAWCYYNLFKWYGGVPLVSEVLDPLETSVTPRSTSKQTYEFILNDLNIAASLLGKTASNYGRVTSGTARALKGRLMLLWCSPMFNRADDKTRWETAYKEMKSDLDSINACGYALYNPVNDVNASGFASMFTTSDVNPEAVFVTLYNDEVSDEGTDTQKNNSWEKSIRPANTGGSGKRPSKMLIDLFPMADGALPPTTETYTKLRKSQIGYNEELPFVQRDPRFYRTFAFPGFRWAYNGDATPRDQNNPADGKNYELWSYVWYTSTSDAGDPESGSYYGADNLLKSCQGVYVRKKSDDLDVNATPLYKYEALLQKGAAPFISAAPLMELRYAEVLLNLAEVAAGAGDFNYAMSLVKQIRQRAGIQQTTTKTYMGSDGLSTSVTTDDYGLTPSAYSDRATCLSQVLYERQIEFAYEGKRFDDLRRWMLFDGGAETPSGAPSTWKLTGFDGNTCNYLGYNQLNGQRRENVLFRTGDSFGVGGTTYGTDPIKDKSDVERCAAVDLRQDLDSQVEVLASWYKANLKYKEQKGDSYDSSKAKLYMKFRPNYYFLGFTSGASAANKALPQTIGWTDYNTGAEGTFDPLAE